MFSIHNYLNYFLLTSLPLPLLFPAAEFYGNFSPQKFSCLQLLHNTNFSFDVMLIAKNINCPDLPDVGVDLAELG